MTALAGVQQKQSTLQNTEKWNTTNSKKFLVLKEFEGCLINQLYSDYQRFITTDGFEIDQTLFTNISSESSSQLIKGSRILSYLYKKITNINSSTGSN